MPRRVADQFRVTGQFRAVSCQPMMGSCHIHVVVSYDAHVAGRI